MYFILSKILSFLLQPITWLLLLLLFALTSKRPLRQKRAISVALFVLLFFSNKFIFTRILQLWEVNTMTLNELDRSYDIGILLGGYSAPEIIPNEDRHNFNSRANRFNNAIELYFKGKIKKILISGGTSSIIVDYPREASAIEQYLLTLGVPAEDLIVEPNSRNTRENAVFSAEIIQRNYPEASCLLITSAWHMRRAHGCFRKVNLSAIPFSVDFMNEAQRPSLGFYLLPSPDVFENWEYILREWVGYLVYRGRGYI